MAEDSNIEVGDDLKSKVNALHMQFFCFCFCQHPSKIPKSGQNQADNMLYQGATRKVAVRTVLRDICRTLGQVRQSRAAIELTYY